jgi:replicative DNA helicase
MTNNQNSSTSKNVQTARQRELTGTASMELEGRLPPQNIEAEQSVLGSLMLDKEAIVRVADILKPDDFYRTIHANIFQAMLELYEKNEPIDLLSLTNRLEEKKQLEEIGGASYLTSLVNTVPTAAHVVHYAKIIKNKKILRDLIETSHQIVQLSYQEPEDVENLVDTAEQKIFSISQKSINQKFLPVKDTLEEAFERIDKLHRGDGTIRGIPTGFIDLDNYLAGLQKSDLIVLASRPSLGKTTLALDFARHIAVKSKIPVAIFSLEMSKEQLVDRLICAQAEVDLWRMRTGRLSGEGPDNDFQRIQQALDDLSAAPIFIDDTPSPTVLQMRTMARRLQAEHNIGLIIIDYLQMIQPRRLNDSPVQQVTETSRGLKALARELNIPVLALSQLSRAVESRSPAIPKLSDLRESGAIEQDSDVVLLIYREDKDKPNTDRKNIADIIIAKHRNGPTGRVELFFNESQVSFKNLERHLGE